MNYIPSFKISINQPRLEASLFVDIKVKRNRNQLSDQHKTFSSTALSLCFEVEPRTAIMIFYYTIIEFIINDT